MILDSPVGYKQEGSINGIVSLALPVKGRQLEPTLIRGRQLCQNVYRDFEPRKKPVPERREDLSIVCK